MDSSAVLNGWEYKELKSQWDIIRQKYEFIKKKNETENRDDLEIPKQLFLFDEI